MQQAQGGSAATRMRGWCEGRQGYSTRAPQGIILLVDVALFTLSENELCVFLHAREKDPFRGAMALPGGYVRPDEDASALGAATRVLQQKVGVRAPYLEQLGTYSGPHRDPGGWSATVAYFALVPKEDLVTDGMRGVWVPVSKIPGLAFDHGQIVADAIDRIRNKSAYSSLPVFLAGEQFTLARLHAVYEAILGTPIDRVSFRRRMDEIGAIEPIKGVLQTGQKNRPAQIYRRRASLQDRVASLTRGFGAR